MRLKAIGRFLLVRTDYDMIDAMASKSVITLPRETTDRLKGGFQVSTILSIGQSAFDDEPPEVRAIISRPQRQIITGRYPGHEIDFHPLAQDKDVLKVRMISCDEVHGIVAMDDEEGYDVN